MHPGALANKAFLCFAGSTERKSVTRTTWTEHSEMDARNRDRGNKCWPPSSLCLISALCPFPLPLPASRWSSGIFGTGAWHTLPWPVSPSISLSGILSPLVTLSCQEASEASHPWFFSAAKRYVFPLIFWCKMRISGMLWLPPTFFFFSQILHRKNKVEGGR